MSFTPHSLDDHLDLELTREIDVPPEKVWQAWTTPDLLTQWFTPKPYETTQCEIDLRPGGVFRTVMRSPEGEEMENAGCYLEVVPNERLVWTSALAPAYRPQPGELPMTAIIELQPTASGGTRYRAIAMHQNEADVEVHRTMGFEQGWGAALDQLVEVMQQR